MTSGVYIRTEETKRKIKKARTGTHHSEESKRKISEAMIGNQYNLGKHPSLETKKKMSDSHKGMNFSEQHRKNISKAKMGNQYNLGKHFSKEHRKKMSNSHKGKQFSEKHKRKLRENHKGMLGKCFNDKAKKKMSKAAKNRWKNPKYKEKQLKAMFIGLELRPTNPERRLRNGLNKLFPKEYKYVGDGTIFIGYKNPDFINTNNQKKIIELFGDYWHSKKRTGRTKSQEENQRIKHFSKYGFKTLIIWECELKNIKQLKKKLIEFHKS